MKHGWKFSDGTNAEWSEDGSVQVGGVSPLADGIRLRLRLANTGRTTVRITPPPGGMVDLDLKNVWLVDRLLRTEAPRFRVQVVSSTYTPRDEDIPPQMLDMVQRSRNWDPLPPGAIP